MATQSITATITLQSTIVQPTTQQTRTMQSKPTCHNRRNIKLYCPAGCGKEFVGKDPNLGILRHLRTYAKQWNKYQKAQINGGVRQALTKDLDDIKKHWEEHKKSILYSTL